MPDFSKLKPILLPNTTVKEIKQNVWKSRKNLAKLNKGLFLKNVFMGIFWLFIVNVDLVLNNSIATSEKKDNIPDIIKLR